ncbi:hypothetical protein APHAL10511_005390 [Amanita phalloides]|nr:hypothetical protein APHAL10511_005390 [Amanita phalloides]
MRTIIFSLVIGLFAITTAYAANNWDEPCTSGVCHYDLDPNKGPNSGTVKVWGSHKAISDITPAAGWHILECEEGPVEQMIRMVCISQTAPCSHLFSHSGPENKIIRLPERCGKNPFARVVRVWTSHDQSFPPKLARRLQKRDGRLPLVYNVAFDTNFHAVDPKIHGPINFAIQAATIPTVDLNIDTHLPFEKRSGRPVQRSHKDIVARSIKSIRDSIKPHVEDADHASVNRRDVGSFFHKVKTGVVGFAKSAKNDAKHFVHDPEMHFKKHKTFSFSPTFNKQNITLLRETLNCAMGKRGPRVEFGVEVDLNPQGSVHVVIGVSASGTIIPPDLVAFKTVTHLSAHIDAVLTVAADVLVRIEKGPPPIVTIPIDAITFPGILTLGPEFQLNLLLGVAVDIVIGTRLDIGYHVKNAVYIFPKEKGEKSSPPEFGFNKGHVTMASTPFVRGVAQIDLHVIPTIFVGIDAFGTLSGTKTMLDMFLLFRIVSEYNRKTHPIKTRRFDDMDLASRDVFDAGHLIHKLPRSMGEMGLGPAQGRNTVNVEATNKRDVEDLPPSSLYKREAPTTAFPAWAGSGLGLLPGVDTKKSAQINACGHVLVIIDGSIGATKNLFNIFDTNTRYSFYRQVYLIYQHCVGTSQPKGGSTVNNFKDWWTKPLLPRGFEDTSPWPKTSLVKRGEGTFACPSTSSQSAIIFGTQDINLSKTRALR